MQHILYIHHQKARINYDEELQMFRGEFIGLTGYSDFFAKNLDELKIEGEISLRVYLQACEEDSIQPYR